MGDSSGESPEGRDVPPGNISPTQPLHHSASTRERGFATAESILPGRGNHDMPASRVSSGPCSTTHTGDPFLKISGATRWLGQVSSMACLQAGEEPWLDSLDGARTTLGLTATGRRTHFLLFRQSDTLVPPGPLQSIPSEGQQASTWAAPTHCTQRRSLRTPELLINRELDTLHCFRQTPYTVRVGEKSHGHP